MADLSRLQDLATNDTVAAVEANRLNALKSTGPRSEEGKRISRHQHSVSGYDPNKKTVRYQSPKWAARGR
jgi:hypothetical protein